MHQIIVYAFPVFALLMAAEFAYGRARQRNTYRLNDAIASLSQGLLSQLVAVCTQLFQIGLYALLLPYLAVVHAPAFWDSGYGWVLAIVLFDFCDYWLHRVGHESAVFWAAHVVHHQSQDFNFSTALRQESTVALLGWPFYLPMAVLGIPAEQYALAGLVVLLYQFWIHTEHVGKLGWFDRVFSSPSNHRVHHAVNDPYIDKNYGAIFVLWDRLFGTFAEEKEPCIYGTRAPLNSWNPLWAVADTYWAIAKDAWRAERWFDKLRIWFKAPGWRPADVAARYPAAPFDLAAVRRFDPPLSSRHMVVAACQFVGVVLASAAFLWFADDLSLALSAWLTAMIAAALWALGALMQGRIGMAALVGIDLLAIAAAGVGLR
jgi:sterol desaturase/sphingolipid hydroxylase (fatty acid hydroxylase superfamily)